jgi:hypothetical protein
VGAAGDANGDGERNSREDEFVELANTGSETVDISGWILGDDDVDQDRWFQFGMGVSLAPGESISLAVGHNIDILGGDPVIEYHGINVETVRF